MKRLLNLCLYLILISLVFGDFPSENIELSGRALAGPCKSICIDGDIAYVGGGDRFMVLDISISINPDEIGHVYLDGIVYHIQLYNHYAYVTTTDSDIYVIDISDPENPCIVKKTARYNAGLSFDISGNYLYNKKAWSSSLIKYDISSPDTMIEISSVTVPSSPSRVLVKDDYVYASCRSNGLYIFNFSDSIPYVETILDSINTYNYEIYDNYIFAEYNDEGLAIIDISDPSTASIETVLFTDWEFTSFAFDSCYMYTSGHHPRGHIGYFDVYDISSLTSITRLSHIESSNPAYDIMYKNNTIYLANEDEGMKIFNVHDPYLPVEYNFNTDGSRIQKICNYGSYAYAMSSNHDIYIIDFSDPHNPERCGTIRCEANDLCISNGYLYVICGEDGLRIFDLEEPESPRSMSRNFEELHPRRICVAGNYAYMCLVRGLLIVDISNPLFPSSVSHLEYTSNSQMHISYAKDHIFISLFLSDVKIFNVSDPADPIESTVIDVPGSAENCFIDDAKAYIACDDEGLFVYDVSVPYLPEEISFYEDRYAEGVKVWNNYAYLLSSDDLKVIDFSRPEEPRIIGYMHMQQKLYDIDFTGNHATIAYSDGGMCVLDISYFTVGVEEQPAQTPQNYALSAYPNPFNSTVEINIPGGASEIEIFDTYGRSMLKSTIPTNSLTWSPSEETSSGVYIVNAKTLDSTTLTEKVIYAK